MQSDESTSPRSDVRSPATWRSRRYLPHLDIPGVVQHISFHVGDALPLGAIERMREDLLIFREHLRARLLHRRIDEYLDRGIGSCPLRQDTCARIVQDSLLFGDGERYRLLAWVVMPNHVHAMIEPLGAWMLSRIVQSWKRHTARQIHMLDANDDRIETPGPFWQRGYWDRYIRDDRHYVATVRYIENNPVAAGLVASPEDWLWGSARYRRVLPSDLEL